MSPAPHQGKALASTWLAGSAPKEQRNNLLSHHAFLQPWAVALYREACCQCSAVVQPGRSRVKHTRPTSQQSSPWTSRLGHVTTTCFHRWLSLEFKGQRQKTWVVQEDFPFLSSCWWLKREMRLSDQLLHLSTHWSSATKQNGTQSMPYHKGIWYPAFSLLFSSKARGHHCTHLAFRCTQSRQSCFLHSRCRLQPIGK